jgi:hypothetical protein
MDTVRFNLLDTIGFWRDPTHMWRMHDKGWMENYERLKAYQLKTGPGSFPPRSYPKLGSWVHN